MSLRCVVLLLVVGAVQLVAGAACAPSPTESSGDGDGDDNGEEEDDDDGVCGTCPQHARCDASGAAPVCVCTPGYEGAACAVCSYGYREVDAACVLCVDEDDDGFLPAGCQGPDLVPGVNADCDDDDARVPDAYVEGPRGTAACTDGLDNDCDGLVDDDAEGCAQPCNDDGWCVALADLNQSFNDVIMFASDDAWAVGAVAFPEAALALHWDGEQFTPYTFELPVPLERVYGVASDDVWASGYGVLLHWDGVTWTDVSDLLPPPPGGLLAVNFESMWGSAHDDVYATTYGLHLLHYDGTRWDVVRENPSSTASLSSEIGGCAADDIWIVDGAIHHYDGVTGPQGLVEVGLNALDAGASIATLSGAAAEPFIAGGGVWRFNGANFERGDGTGLRALAATHGATTTMWVAGDGGALARWDGTAFNPVVAASDNGRDWRQAFAATVGDTLLLVTRSGEAARWDGTRLVDVADATFTGFDAVFFAPAEVARSAPHGFAASGSSIYRTSGTAPNVQWTFSDSLNTSRINGLWGSSADDVYAVGDNATIFHFDGSDWSQLFSGVLPNVPGEAYRAVAGTSSTDVWVLGEATLLHFDGAWRLIETPAGVGSRAASLHVADATNVWFAWSTTVLHYDGRSVAQIVSPLATHVQCHAQNDVSFVLREGLNVTHYDGTRFTTSNADSSMTAADVSIVAADDIWLCGINQNGEPRIGHYDGTSWAAASAPVFNSTASLLRIAVVPDGSGIIVGAGTVLVRKP